MVIESHRGQFKFRVYLKQPLQSLIRCFFIPTSEPSWIGPSEIQRFLSRE
jgi:hypothetical protein